MRLPVRCDHSSLHRVDFFSFGPLGVEDNEPTGLLFSDGDSSVGGLIGTRKINPSDGLLFFTMQHGENNLYLIQPQGDSQD